MATVAASAPPHHPSSPRFDPDTVGMYYDIDAAILATFKVDDAQAHMTWDDSGQIIAAVELTRSLPSLAHLTRAFYRFWGQVCLARSEIHRRIEEDSISFSFETGGDRLAYHGVVTFHGEPVRAVLRRLRSERAGRHLPASRHPETR